MPPLPLKARVFHALEGTTADHGHRQSPAVYAISAIIVLNIAAIILDSVEPVRATWGTWLVAFEWFSVAVFTVEYAARLWSCTSDPRYGGAVRGRLRYATTLFSIIDLLAILPTYALFVAGSSGVDLTFLRALRLFRLFRVFKLGRYSEAARHLSAVFRERRHDLAVAAGVAAVFLLVSSSIMYEAEHEAQPDKFSSILDAMWWGVVTLGTVGYGDVFPVTPLGKVLGGFAILAGIAFIAMPTAILAGGFLTQLEKARAAKPCPHCGKLESDPVESRRLDVASSEVAPRP
jgi:voltage-gated potassium channel